MANFGDMSGGDLMSQMEQQQRLSEKRRQQSIEEALGYAQKYISSLETIYDQIDKASLYSERLSEDAENLRKMSEDFKAKNESRFDQYDGNDLNEKMKSFMEEYDSAMSLYNENISNSNKEIQEYTRQIAEIKEDIEDVKKSKDGSNDASIDEVIDEYLDQIKSLKESIKSVEIDIEKSQDLKKELEKTKSIKDDIEAADKKADIAKTESLRAQLDLQEIINKKEREGYNILDEYEERFKDRSELFKKGIKEAGDGLRQMGDAIKKTADPWFKAEEAAFSYSKAVGSSKQQTEQFLRSSLDWATSNNIGLLFNKTTEDLIKMQASFSDTLGRNVQLTGEQKENMIAMSNVIGDQTAMDIAGNLDVFGMGMSDTAEFVHDMYSEAQQYGLSASKLTKSIASNISMAQQFTFKDGLKGLESMARKALELKTDMTLVSGMLEKASTLEGAISMGANLQVLGGSFAMGSNPLDMMYEGLNDAEGMFDRIVNMTAGKAFYNRERGEVEMGAYDRQMVKQMASATGLDYNKIMQMAYRQASLGEINGQMNQSSFLNAAGNESLKNMVSNMATMKGGKAVVNLNGEDVEVGKIGEGHRDTLIQMQKTDSQNMIDMAVNLRSMNETISGAAKERDNFQAWMMKDAGEFMKDVMGNTGLIAMLMQASAMVNILGGVGNFAGGAYNGLKGVSRFGKGAKQLFHIRRGAPSSTAENVAKNVVGNAPKNAEGIVTEQTVKGTTAKGSGLFSKGMIAGNLKSGLVHGGAGAVIAGGATLMSAVASGEYDRDRSGTWGDTAGSSAGALVGGIVGSFIPVIGPIIGPMIGGFLGKAASDAIQGSLDKSRNRLKGEISASFEANGQHAIAALFNPDSSKGLKGRYKESELKKIQSAISDGSISKSEVGNSLWRELNANGDLNSITSAGIQVRATGGMTYGSSHENGGELIEMEGGEYTLNKYAVRNPVIRRQAARLNSGNPIREESGSLSIKVAPSDASSINSMSVSKITIKKAVIENNSSSRIEPIKLDVSGRISLDLGGKTKDISSDILNDPVFIKNITDMIMKNMNVYDNGGYDKEKHLQKFG